MKTAVIAGATGLIGKQLLEALLQSRRYSSVIALTRRPLALKHPELKNVITDFQQLDRVLTGIVPDDVFCCLGTTMAKAGSKEKFYEVDFQFPLDLARATRGLGAKQYLLVSAVGADAHSKIYYNRVKGEVEKYKAISSEKVAGHMVAFAARDMRGTFIHESRDLQGM